MFRVPIAEITKGSLLRQKGKVAELALGYQGGKAALEKMGALKMGLTPEELPGLVEAWRIANPAIVRLWGGMENGALAAVRTKQPVTVRERVTFALKKDALWVRLPSGRELAYQHPKIETGRFGREALTYAAQNQTTKKWERTQTYGGKLTENTVQAIARDVLAEAMLRLEEANYPICFHVHDEVIVEGNAADLRAICDLLGKPLPWAQGLLLKADGFTAGFYKKE